jgi:hypothetical protein
VCERFDGSALLGEQRPKRGSGRHGTSPCKSPILSDSLIIRRASYRMNHIDECLRLSSWGSGYATTLVRLTLSGARFFSDPVSTWWRGVLWLTSEKIGQFYPAAGELSEGRSRGRFAGSVGSIHAGGRPRSSRGWSTRRRSPQ